MKCNVQGNPRGFALQPEFVDGVRAVGANGLVFDLCITADQLLDATGSCAVVGHDLRARPGLNRPFGPDAFRAVGTSTSRRLAEFENVSCKLSGLASETGPSNAIMKDCSATRVMRRTASVLSG